MGIRHEDVITIIEEGAENLTKWSGSPEEPAVLSSLAERTGGHAHVTLSAMGVARALNKIASEIGFQYRLTYRTVSSVGNPKIEVKVARPGAKARVAP